MDLFWLIPLLLIILFLFWRGARKIRSEGGEPTNTPQGRVPPRDET